MAFNRDNRSGGNRDFGKRSFGSDRPQLFKATCANCGNECEVPFKPTGSRPVLCRDCFKSSGGNDARRSDERGFNKPQFGNRPQFENRNAPARPAEQPQYDRQFAALNAKLDMILKMITPTVPVETELNEEIINDIVEEIEDTKPLKKKAAAKKKDTPKTAKKKTKSPKKA